MIALSLTTLLYAQDSNIISSLSVPAYGVKIKVNYPSIISSGFARTFSVSNQDVSFDFFTLGVFGAINNQVSTMTYGYSGHSYYDPEMVFLPNGNIEIGTTRPTTKFAVNGNIRAKEVKVDDSRWPDCVFFLKTIICFH